MLHQPSVLIAAQLSPCQWAYVVNFTAGNLLAAALSWAVCRLWMQREDRCSFASHWGVISIAWLVSLVLAWAWALPLVRRALNWQTAYADDYATAWYTMLAWGILFVIAAAAIGRILWRRAKSYYWARLALCIAATVVFALPCYWWFCSGSFVTQLADTSTYPSTLAGWAVYYVDGQGDVRKRSLSTGGSEVVSSAVFGPGETVFGEGRAGAGAGAGGTLLFTSSADTASLELENATTMNRDGLHDVVDWTDARGGPPRINAGQCLVLRNNQTRQAVQRYCMDLPFVCGFIHAAEHWFMSHPTLLPGGFIVLQVGRREHAAIVLVDTASGRRQYLDAGQAPVVVRETSGASAD